MVFTSTFAGILNRFLGEYVSGINSENMDVSLWNGKITLNNIAIKPEAIDQMDIPFTLKYSKLGNLFINASLTSISSQPVEVILNDLVLVLQTKDRSSWDDLNCLDGAKIWSILENFKTIVKEKFETSQSGGGGEVKDEDIGGLVQKIIDNIKINVSNIHVRLENGAGDSQNWSCGAVLDSLECFTCNGTGEFVYTERKSTEDFLMKKLALGKLAAYWNWDDQTVSDESTDKFADPETLWALPGNEIVGLKLELFMTIRPYCKSIIEKNLPQFEFDVALESAQFNLNRPQVQQLLGLLEFAGDFYGLKGKALAEKQNKFMRPYLTISGIDNTDTSDSCRSYIVRRWWQYAIQAVIRTNRARTGKIPGLSLTRAKYDIYQKSYTRIYDSIDQKASGSKNFSIPEYLGKNSDQQGSKMRNYLEFIPMVIQKDWIESYEKEKVFQELSAKKAKESQGWFSWAAGSSTTSLSQEQKDDIRKKLDKSLTIWKQDENKPAHYFMLRFTGVIKDLGVRVTNGQNQFELLLKEKFIVVDSLGDGFEIKFHLKEITCNYLT